MNVKIFRFDPSVDTEPHYDSFSVEVSAEEKMTGMGLLEYISKHFDSSLSFFSHSACRHGICGRCTVKCNGKACLACTTVLSGEDITIDPLKKDVVKELVVRN